MALFYFNNQHSCYPNVAPTELIEFADIYFLIQERVTQCNTM